MTFPTSEPLEAPEEQLPPARRRRQRRQVIPDQSDERARFLDEIGQQTTPGAEFFLSALLSGLIFSVALLLDAPALAILAVLLAPFMGPVIGLGVASVAGSASFLLRSLASLVTGGLIFFLTGTLSGWIARLLPPADYVQTGLHLAVTWPDAVLLAVGVGLTTYLMARSSQSRPSISSIAIAYEVFLPLGAAGFALTSGSLDGPAWGTGLLVFGLHLLGSALVGMLVLAVMGLRPRALVGYVLSGIYILACLVGVVYASGQGLTLPALPAANNPAQAAAAKPQDAPKAPAQPQKSPTPPAMSDTPAPAQAAQPATLTPSSTPTHTLVPTRTPTLTVTPQSTPVWARIHAKDGNGAYIRAEANYNSNVVSVLLNGILVQVLEDVKDSDGTTWVKVRTADGKEGWIVRALLTTATPAPGW